MVRWLAILLLLVSLDAAAQSVGRVLAAAGDVTALRGGATLPLAAGVELQNGDLVVTGEASVTQLRFSDGAIVALRDRSRFHIADYRFTGSDDGVSQAAFSLLKGGLRTITGLIGRARAGQYRLRTPLATVGVRGTAYSVVHCEQDCEDDDGVSPPDGTYGLVFEGRIAVANEGGEREFGPDEAFFVADAATAPQPLLARPRLLRDRLEVRARRQERREEIQARTAALIAQRQAAARFAAAVAARANDPSGRPVALVGTELSPIVVTELRDDSGNVALLGPGLGAGVGFAVISAPIALVDGGRGTVIELDASRGFLDRFSFNGGAQAGDRGNAAVVDNGRIEGDGGAVWGRWVPGGAVRIGDVAGVPPTGVHFFFGNLTPESLFANVPAAATAVRYDYAGGPRPTDGQGNAGQFLAGSFIVNFVHRSIGGGVSYRVADFTYTLPVPQGTALVGGRGFVGFNVVGRGAGSWSSALGNAGGALDAYTVSGIFLGSRAQGMGVTFATDDARAGRSAGVGIFRCVSGGCK